MVYLSTAVYGNFLMISCYVSVALNQADISTGISGAFTCSVRC